MDKYMDRINAGIEKCESVRGMALRREISAFDLMEQTTQITRDMIKEEFRQYAPRKGMAIFVYGSASRNEMVTYSDVDIFFIETKSCNNAIKNILKSLVYGFGTVHEFEARRQETIERYVKYSLTDRDKIIFAQFVVGDQSISNWMDDLKIQEHKLGSGTEHIIFQKYHLRDYYYVNNNTKEAANVKLQNGGTYDLVMYGLFDNAMSLYRGNKWMRESESNRPKIESTLKNFNKNGILSNAEYDKAKAAAEFMIILRNEILHINKNTKDNHMAYIDKSVEHRVFESAYQFFKSQGINTPEELHKAYEGYRNTIYETKEHTLKILLREEEKRKGKAWRKSFDMAEKGELSTPTGDSLIDIAMIWGLNHVGDKNSFNKVANQLNWNWGTCASIACSRLASPEMLERIRSHCQPFSELGYVLWLISENPNATKETITSIAKDLPLGFWSVTAKRRLEDSVA